MSYAYFIFDDIPLRDLAFRCFARGCKRHCLTPALTDRYCLAHRLHRRNFPKKSTGFPRLARRLARNRDAAKFAAERRMRQSLAKGCPK